MRNHDKSTSDFATHPAIDALCDADRAVVDGYHRNRQGVGSVRSNFAVDKPRLRPKYQQILFELYRRGFEVVPVNKSEHE